MQTVRQPNRSTMDADRAKSLFDAIRRRIMRGETSHQDVKARVFEAFTKYFSELSQPITEDTPLMSLGLRDPDDYRDFIETVAADLQNATQDARNLSEGVVAGFNASTTQVRQLEAQVKRATNKSQDLQHLSSTYSEDTIVAGDDFVDDSRIDKGMTLEAPMIELPFNQNVVALRRTEAKNVLEGGQAVIRILSTFRIYEGKFYALEGEARPEGGTFHWSGTDNSIQTDASAPGVPPDLLTRYNNWRTGLDSSSVRLQTPSGELQIKDITAEMAYIWSTDSPDGWGPFSQNEWDMLANNFHFDPTFASEPGYIRPTAREVATDKGAPLDERQSIRSRMIDDDPDTFWEGEFVIDASEALGQSQNANVSDEASPPEPQLTLGQIMDLVAGPAIDKIDLDCSIIIELPAATMLNWVNLLPHNFSDSSWLEVVNVSTSLDGSEYEQIEGIAEHKFENILTEDVNKELSQEEVASTLAPNKFQYTGQGVWTFPARVAKFIKLDLLQKTPIPAPYDILRVELSQTVVTTTTSTKDPGLLGLWSSASTKVGTQTDYEERTIEMSYSDTLQVLQGQSSLSGLETPPGSEQRTLKDKAGSLVVQVLTAELAGGSHHIGQQVESGGWKVKDQYTVTKWDRARYGIGVKELGIWAYQYDVKSGFVSVPFKTPKPIRSVSLHADELIPKAFNADDVRPWIKYWLSLDDGQNWHPIAPVGEGPAARVDGKRVPQSLHVNTGLPEAERDPRTGYVDFDMEVNTMRLKAILERPDGITDMTPVLKGYRLRAIVRGGL